MRGSPLVSGWALAALTLGVVRMTPAFAEAVISESTDLPEVEVVGRRLYQMQKAIIQTEDKFLARYNELNKDHAFDVHCSNASSKGTRIHKRTCQVQFYEDAAAAWARSQLTGDYAPPPDLVALERGPEYKQKALAVINGDRELRRLLRTRDALEQKYFAARKEAFKHHWFAF